MCRRYLFGPLLLFIALFPVPGWSIPFSNLFILGDSLSDSGNVALMTAQRSTPPFSTLMATAPYASGRFSNGPVWAEQLAADLHLSAAPSLLGGTDFAFGGARSGPLPGLPATASPTLRQQLQMLLASPWSKNGRLPSDSLFAVGVSATIYETAALAAALTAAGVDPTTVDLKVNAILDAAVANLAGVITALSAAGAMNLLILNAPDLGLTPAARSAGLAAEATLISASFNDLLAAELASLAATLPVNLHSFDLFQMLREVVAQPERFGLSNATDPCIHVNTTVDPFCANPDAYLFWDEIHPTTAGHAVLASAVYSAFVPEPSTFALLGIGLVGLGFWRKRLAGAVRGESG